MKKYLFLSALVLAFGCTPKNHKVTFNINLESTEGNTSFVLECYKANEVLDFMAGVNKSMMEGKANTVAQPKPVATYNSKGRPADNKFDALMELPEDEITCAIPPMSFITMRMGEKAGQVFKPLADTNVKVAYNMHTQQLLKADSSDAKIAIIK